MLGGVQELEVMFHVKHHYVVVVMETHLSTTRSGGLVFHVKHYLVARNSTL